MYSMRNALLQSSVTLFAFSVVGCSNGFSTSLLNGNPTQETDSSTNDSGNSYDSGVYDAKGEASNSQQDSGSTSITIPTSPSDSGSKPNESIRVQDSGRPKTEVVKPWWETNPDGVCVPNNPKQCASGCSCVHNNQPWCCI